MELVPASVDPSIELAAALPQDAYELETERLV
jgi:hypothetical protein